MKLIKPEEFTAVAELNLNKDQITLKGNGSVDFAFGVVKGDYKLEKKIEFIDPFLFKTVLVTGYPSVCTSDHNIYNPFQYGNYNYHRVIDFGEYGSMEYLADCKFEDHDDLVVLNSKFDVSGDVRVPALNKAHPLIETWVPQGNTIQSAFVIAWQQVGTDKYVIGNARSTYFIPEGVPNITSPIQRSIKFSEAKRTSDELFLIQESKLFIN